MNGKTRSIIGRLPDFYTRDEDSVLVHCVELFGAVLADAETDLKRVMLAHWVDKADNTGSQGLDSAQKGDLDKIFTLYLESLGGTSQLRQADDALYRKRIKGLIQVLMRGASTLDGIKTIVAANLGILEDASHSAADVQAARSSIRIVEFSPDATAGAEHSLALYEPFTVNNPNPEPVIPQLRLTLRPDLRLTLAGLRVAQTPSGAAVTFNGELGPGDVLELFADGSALLNGVTAIIGSPIPPAPPGLSNWQVEALAVVGAQRLPVGRFDVSVFDALPPDHPDPTVWMPSGPALHLRVSLTQLTPGIFTVVIPWDIPGFTAGFDNLSDDPRRQIGYIVDKVKAAGVRAAIVYEKTFPTEAHEIDDQWSGSGVRQPFAEDQELGEVNFDIGSVQTPYPGGVDQGLDDHFTASGVFDLTTFDSLNTFAA
jgi:hypothetical protein